MSEPAANEGRPTQVTVASWLIMVGSVFVVLMVWDRIAGLHSMASRQALQAQLNQPGLKGLGLQLTDLMTLVKTLSMVAAGCATAMAILGYQALQRSRSARVVLTILAVPLFLAGLVTGGFVSSGVAAAVATLWLRPARLWYDGRTAQPATGPTARSTAAPDAGRPTSSDRPAQTPPPSLQAWAPPPTSSYGAPVRTTTERVDPAARPAAVLWAAVITWLFSGLAVLVLGASLVVMSTDSGLVLDKMHEQNPDLATQGISDHLILVVAYATCAAFVLWAVAAVVVALLAFRGRRWAWYAHVISTVGVIGVCVLGVLGSLLMLVPLAAAAAVVSMLVRPEVRRWAGVG